MSVTKSVKISSDAKLILDTIQEKLHMGGISITEQKILDALIEHTDINTIKKFFHKEEKEAIAMLKHPVHWGIKDSSDNMDKYIYEENR